MKQAIVGLPSENNRVSRGDLFPRYMAVYVLFLVAAANIAYTQYIAYAFHYDAQLGDPWFGRFYAPWSWHAWQSAYASHYRLTFLGAVFVIGIASVILFFIGMTFVGILARRAAAVSALHGSAHWASEKEIEASGLLPPRAGWLTRKRKKGKGVYVGAWKDKNKKVRYLRHNGPEHILCFAPTRSGKGISLILPTLLSWDQSVVVYDLKSENYELSAGWRQAAGHIILKFDPLDIDGLSAKYNPLEEVRLGTMFEVADTQNIVNMIIDPDGKGLQDHWDKTSLMFLVGVVLYTMYEEKREGRIAALPTVARRMTSEEGIDHLYVAMKENSFGPGNTPHRAIQASAIDMLEKEERERGSVLSTAKTHFLLYVDDVVSQNISRSDFRIRDLMNSDRPVSLYIVVDPENKQRLRPLVRLLITQIVRTDKPRLQFDQGTAVKKYKHRLLLLLDEFAALGKLPIFEDALAHIAGYGLKAYLFVQDLSQLKQAYGDKESISANCHIKNAFAPNQIETAEALSKMTGITTVVKRVTSTSGKRFGMFLGQVNEQLQETQRPLLQPDECMRLPGAKKDPRREGLVSEPGDMLIFAAGHAPIYGRQILFFKDPVFAKRAAIPAPKKSDRIIPR